jgi:hypothetical protein
MIGLGGITEWALPWAAISLDVLLKATVLLIVVAAVDLVLTWRHRTLERLSLWNATIVALLLVPVVASTFPKWRIYCLPSARPVAEAVPTVPPESATEPEPVQALAPAAPAESLGELLASLQEPRKPIARFG